jgi:MYXO-CTERM domain-containing protein
VAGLAVSADASSVAHGIHYALLGLGLVGLFGMMRRKKV